MREEKGTIDKSKYRLMPDMDGTYWLQELFDSGQWHPVKSKVTRAGAQKALDNLDRPILYYSDKK